MNEEVKAIFVYPADERKNSKLPQENF